GPRPERLERADSGGDEDQRKQAVDSPRGPARRPGRQKGWEHFLRAAVQNLRVLKSSGEVGEHAEERERASNEREAAGEDSPARAAIGHSDYRNLASTSLRGGAPLRLLGSARALRSLRLRQLVQITPDRLP